MNLLRKNLFRILVLVAGLGIADNAFAQDGSGTRMGSLDGTLRTQRLTLPFIKFGAVSATATITPANAIARGIQGNLVYAPHATSAAVAWGHTLTTSIAPMAYPARVVFALYPLGGISATNQLGCKKLEVDGLDQFGREVGLSGNGLPRYKFGPLISGSPHTSSIAFSKITRIRLEGCFSGTSCTNPGYTCSTAPANGSQFRALMTRHVGLPFRVKDINSIQSVCVSSAGSGSTCFRNDAVVRQISSEAQATWLSFNASRNTLSFPDISNASGLASRRTVISLPASDTSGQTNLLLVDRFSYTITYKADIRTE